MATVDFPTSPNTGDSYTYNGVTYTYDGVKWTAAGTGAAALWTRTGTVVSPKTAGDDVTTTGDVNAANVVATGDVQATSLNSGPLAGFRNHIINGDFRVWQRGTTGFPGGGEAYTADRWRTKDGSRIQRTGTAPNGFADAIVFAAAANTTWIRQAIELPRAGNPGPFIAGSTWTASCWTTLADGDIFFGNGFADGNSSINFVEIAANTAMTSTGETNNGFTRFSITFTISVAPAGTNLAMIPIFGTLSGATGFTTGIQLEPGPVATPFEHRPIGTELALCQRYYFKTESSTNCALMDGGCSGANTATMTRDLPITMRAKPTLSYVNLTLQPGNIQSASPTTNRSTPDRLSVLWAAAGLTVGNSYWMEAVSGATGSISAAAEL